MHLSLLMLALILLVSSSLAASPTSPYDNAFGDNCCYMEQVYGCSKKHKDDPHIYDKRCRDCSHGKRDVLDSMGKPYGEFNCAIGKCDQWACECSGGCRPLKEGVCAEDERYEKPCPPNRLLR